MVRGINHGELEPPGILQVQVDLTVLGLVGRARVGPNVCLELVETKGDELFIIVSTRCRGRMLLLLKEKTPVR